MILSGKSIDDKTGKSMKSSNCNIVLLHTVKPNLNEFQSRVIQRYETALQWKSIVRSGFQREYFFITFYCEVYWIEQQLSGKDTLPEWQQQWYE